MKFKRILSLILSAAVAIPSATVIPAAADASERVDQSKYVVKTYLADDFESYEVGDKISATDNIYAVGGSTEWGSNPAAVAVEEITDNKVAALSGTMYKVPFIGSDNLVPNLLIKARVKPMLGTSEITIQEYTPANYTLYPVTINNGAVSCYGSSVGTVQMDKWTDIEIILDVYNNRSFVYVNGVLMKEQENVFSRRVNMPIIRFISNTGGDKAYWDDVLIREMNEIEIESKQEKPNNLEELEGVHPRIFATEERFEEIKRLAKHELSEEYEQMIRGLDAGLSDEPPKWVAGGEQNWMNGVASTIEGYTLGYKLTGEQKYKDAAKKWAEAGIAYPTWGGDGAANNDLAASAMFVATSCYYDWMYHELSEEERARFVAELAERGETMNKGGWYNLNYLQNHLWIARGGLMVAAAAIYDVYEPAVSWFGTANESYRAIFMYLGEENGDAASHEGFGYYTYGLNTMLHYVDIAKSFLNVDYTDHPYLTKAYRYISDMVVPGTYDGKGKVHIWTYGDVNQPADVDFIPELARIASLSRSGETQWWVNHWRDMINDNDGNQRLWELLRYYDDSVEEVPFEQQGRSNDELFDSLGLFFSRSGWERDSSLVAYHCGTLFGKELFELPPRYDAGWGHNHGDMNSMNIYSRGDYMLWDSEYGNGHTSAHSTLLVNGQDQARNGTTDKLKHGEIVKIDSQENLTYSVGDATGIYWEDKTGLTKFKRHFIFLKPDILILVDEVETDVEKTTATDDTEIPVELRFFPATQDYTAEVDGSYSFANPNSNLNIHPLDLQEGVAASIGTIQKGNIPGTGIVVSTTNSKLVQPTVISWNDKDKAPVKVSVVRGRDSKMFEFYTNRDKVVLDVENMEVTHEIIKTGDTAVKLDGVLVEGDYLATLGSDNRFYMEADEIAEVLGLEAEVSGNTVTLSRDAAKTVMTVGSNVVDMNGKEMTIDGTPYTVGDNIMVPVRFAAQGFNIGVDYIESDKVLAFRSNADFSNADLRSISANGVGIVIEEGVYDYAIEGFILEPEISALAKESSTKIEVINNGMDTASVIKTTSADGTNSKTYNVTVSAIRGIGNVGIRGMTFSESDGNVGAYAFDKDLNSRWAVTGFGQWLDMDLGEKVKLDHMLVSYAYGNTRQEYFDIQVSDDGVNWTTIKEDCHSSGTTIEPEKYPLDGVETRYVRFCPKGTGGSGGWNSVGEIGLVKAE